MSNLEEITKMMEDYKNTLKLLEANLTKLSGLLEGINKDLKSMEARIHQLEMVNREWEQL